MERYTRLNGPKSAIRGIMPGSRGKWDDDCQYPSKQKGGKSLANSVATCQECFRSIPAVKVAKALGVDARSLIARVAGMAMAEVWGSGGGSANGGRIDAKGRPRGSADRDLRAPGSRMQGWEMIGRVPSTRSRRCRLSWGARANTRGVLGAVWEASMRTLLGCLMLSLGVPWGMLATRWGHWYSLQFTVPSSRRAFPHIPRQPPHREFRRLRGPLLPG
jgi:hypothetical protein